MLRCMMRIALILRKMVLMSNEEALDEQTNLFHLRKGITLIIEKYKIKEGHLYTVGSILFPRKYVYNFEDDFFLSPEYDSDSCKDLFLQK